MQLWQPSLDEKYLTMTDTDLAAAITARKAELGNKVIILGHHYQVDDVIQHADFTGDSLKLSQLAADAVAERNAETIIFCGVHFMAETADIVAPDGVSVILPDLSAGCSMADMADYEDAIDAWKLIHQWLDAQGFNGRVVPITYVNSSAAIKAFVGMNGGACCTSSNASQVFDWALKGGVTPLVPGEDVKILFLPDQHLGRNTAAQAGFDTDTQTTLYDPKLTMKGEPLGGTTPEQLMASKVILWAGHCSVHKLFRPEHCDQIRAAEPDRTIIVHPESCKDVVDKADMAGSTSYIIDVLEAAEPGSKWAIGTEHNLVKRLSAQVAEKGVDARILSDCQCLCTTMYRIDQPHLLWVLDNLAAGKVVNRVRVHADARDNALLAINRMLDLSVPTASV